MTETASRGLLDGIRVLDFTSMLSGPYCTRLMADLGAEVIKIEDPAGGDHNRSRRPIRDGRSSLYGHLNCGKKSVVLDLKSAAGREAARGLARQADVAIENWRPGVAARLGVAHTDLQAIKPDLVYCSISGYGQEGPSSGRAAYGPIVQAESGFDLAQLAYLGLSDQAPATGTFFADVLAGLSAFGAIQAALLDRQKTAEGRYIDVSLLESMVNLLVFEAQETQFPEQTRRIHRAVRAADGFIMITPTSQKNFENMARAMGHPEWIADERFGKVQGREQNWIALMKMAEAWTQTRPSRECEEILNAAGVPCSRYKTLAETMADPQLAAREAFTTAHDGGGDFLVPNPPFKIPGTRVAARPDVSELGQDTASVLGALLGYSAEKARACGIR